MDARAVTGRVTSAGIVALAAIAPWFSRLPLDGTAAVLAHVLALIAAFHGAGLALAQLARRPDAHPLLAIQWGIATLVGLSGIALVLRVDNLTLQTILVSAFAALHSAVLIARFGRYRQRLAALAPRPWLVPAGLLVLLAVVHVLGAAGDLGARPFDDDGHVLAQLQRLRDTGALADPVGHARSAQLGGQLVLGALATASGDVHLVRLLEAVAFALALGLACARIRPRDAALGLWTTLVVITGSALAFVAVDPVTCWTAVGLILALHAMLADDEPRALLPIAVVAGALITLRAELAPVGVVALAVAWWPHRRDPGRTLLVLGAALAVLLPFVLSRLGGSVPDELRALLAPTRGGLGARLAVFVGIAGAGGALVRWVLPLHPARWFALAVIVVIAGLASELVCDRPYAMRFLWPLAIAGGLVMVIELTRASRLTLGAMLVALVALVLIQAGRDATGRARWTRRYLDLVASIEYLRHAGDAAPIAGGYAEVTRAIPHGATVAVWVTRPERLDYAAGHRIVDLRIPRLARFRTHSFAAHASRIERIVTAAGADYLLLEADDRRAARIRGDFHYRFTCLTPHPACADDLEVLAHRHPIVAQRGGVRLVKLR